MDNIFSFFSVFPFCTPLRMTALAVIKVRVQPSLSLQKRVGAVRALTALFCFTAHGSQFTLPA